MQLNMMMVNTGDNKSKQKDTRRDFAIQEEISEITKKIHLFG